MGYRKRLKKRVDTLEELRNRKARREQGPVVPATPRRVVPVRPAPTPAPTPTRDENGETPGDRYKRRREEWRKRQEEQRRRRREQRVAPTPEPVPAPEPEEEIPGEPEVTPEEPVSDPEPDKYDGKSREQWWTDRFPKQPVLYRAQDGNLRDVRTFVFETSHILSQIVNQYKLKGVNDDETMLKCCLFVQDYIQYVSDQESRQQVEFWQNPEDTVARGTGDCEDGAILMKSLTMCAGVPDWKVKIVAGNVKGGGHAYCTYIRDNDTQCILDWCYWPNRLPVNQRPSFAQEENYYEIWFSFNNAHSFAETRVAYSGGKIYKGAEVAKLRMNAKMEARRGGKSVATRSMGRKRPVKL